MRIQAMTVGMMAGVVALAAGLASSPLFAGDLVAGQMVSLGPDQRLDVPGPNGDLLVQQAIGAKDDFLSAFPLDYPSISLKKCVKADNGEPQLQFRIIVLYGSKIQIHTEKADCSGFASPSGDRIILDFAGSSGTITDEFTSLIFDACVAERHPDGSLALNLKSQALIGKSPNGKIGNRIFDFVKANLNYNTGIAIKTVIAQAQGKAPPSKMICPK